MKEMSEAEHVIALRRAFPGVWIRDDFAFRDDANGIAWEPGDVEKKDDFSRGINGGLCYFGGAPASGRGPRLRLSQLSALVDYISTVNRVKPAIRPDKAEGS